MKLCESDGVWEGEGEPVRDCYEATECPQEVPPARKDWVYDEKIGCVDEKEIGWWGKVVEGELQRSMPAGAGRGLYAVGSPGIDV